MTETLFESPIERDKRLGHKAMVRYLLASGFRLLPEQSPVEEETTIQRFQHRRKIVIECNSAKHAYVVRIGDNPAKYVTRNPQSLITQVERLLEEEA